MAVLATLRQDRAGEWKDLDEYLRELRHRETNALAALANVLAAPAHEQRELAEHGDAGAVLLEMACDLRVPKGARVAAARCLLEADVEDPFVGHLFIGAGDLVTDPRLGGKARELVESGLPCALRLGGQPAQITLAAGAFARAVHAGASAVGVARIKELLASAPQLHAGAVAALFALDLGELPPGHEKGWKRLLEETCAAHRRAPAAARRVGLAPPWPPNLPEAFAPMLRQAEQRNAAVESADAATNPAALKKSTPVAPSGKRRESAQETKKPDTMRPGSPAREKTLAPPIRQSPFRRSIGTVVEVPTTLPPKPMEPLAPLPSRAKDALRFDARGQRVPRPDRWKDEQFDWETPVLPSSSLPPPPRARTAPGAFAPRLQSIFDDRPEAVDRLCATAEARAAVRGEEQLVRELVMELSRPAWRGRIPPKEQLLRLRRLMEDAAHPPPWRAVARVLLDFFVSGSA
jgi:hypothetical protein